MYDKVIGVRLKDEDQQLLLRVCDARGETVSDFVRRCVRRELASLSYYPDEVKKALGVLNFQEGVQHASPSSR